MPTTTTAAKGSYAPFFYFTLHRYYYIFNQLPTFNQQLLSKMLETQREQQLLLETREKQRKEMLQTNDKDSKLKYQKMKEASDNLVNEKAQKTWETLQLKEQIAQHELNKVREAQERRRSIKAIRDEGYEMAKARARKAQEYRMEKLNKELREKQERSDAIKKGFFVLNQMRNTMKDIMTKTNMELKVYTYSP